MSNGPKVVERAEQPYVAIPIKVTLQNWDEANALVGEVIGWLVSKGIDIAGAPFIRYWVLGGLDGEYSLEVGAPTATAVQGDDRVIAGSIPAGTFVTMVHHGHPDQLSKSHAVLQEWAANEGLELKKDKQGQDEVWGTRIEFYLTNPMEQPDPEKWETDLIYQVDSAASL